MSICVIRNEPNHKVGKVDCCSGHLDFHSPSLCDCSFLNDASPHLHFPGFDIIMSSPAPALSPTPTRSDSRNSSGRRSTSLGFLRRSKSNDLIGERKASTKLSRRKQKEVEEEEERKKKAAGRIPPKLPGFSPQPQLRPFGDMSTEPGGANGVPPVPPLPTKTGSEPFDPYARTESMTHRGRYSYANSTVSTLNSPRRVRRRKDPTPYKWVDSFEFLTCLTDIL